MLDLGRSDAVRQRAECACVEVWLSPQTMVVPGSVKTLLGADHMDDAWRLSNSL